MSSVEIVRNLYEALSNKDYAAFAELCDPNLEWIQNEGFPYGGHHHGPAAAVEGVFRTLPRHWDDFGFDKQEFHDAGDTVLVVGAYRGRHKQTGKAFEAAAVHLFDLRDGRVRRFRQFTDTALIARAVT